MHGWSPDGKWLVYTGGRNGEFDIYAIAADGSGTETQPDEQQGAGRRSGVLARTASTSTSTPCAAGDADLAHEARRQRNQEQVTNDACNNWFPHLSPDGKWIVFISFRRTSIRPTIRTTST